MVRSAESPSPCATSARGWLEPQVPFPEARIALRHVRRVADDDVEAPACERVPPVGFHALDVGEAEARRIVARDGERRARHVGGRHMRARPFVGDRERDGARSRRKIEDARAGIARDDAVRAPPASPSRARHEHRARNVQRQSPEFLGAGEVGDRLAFTAPLRECRGTHRSAWSKARRRDERRARRVRAARHGRATPAHRRAASPLCASASPHVHGRAAAYTYIVRP